MSRIYISGTGPDAETIGSKLAIHGHDVHLEVPEDMTPQEVYQEVLEADEVVYFDADYGPRSVVLGIALALGKTIYALKDALRDEEEGPNPFLDMPGVKQYVYPSHLADELIDDLTEAEAEAEADDQLE